MAQLYILDSIPVGFRLKDIFKPISGSITYETGGSLQVARCAVDVEGGPLAITYRGPVVGPDAGDVGFIRAGSEDE